MIRVKLFGCKSLSLIKECWVPDDEKVVVRTISPDETIEIDTAKVYWDQLSQPNHTYYKAKVGSDEGYVRTSYIKPIR